MKKLLYLEDLYNFYVSQNKSIKFSSKDSDTTIVVHIDEPFTYAKNEDNELNMYCPIKLCHTESNINQSYISEKAMKDAMPSAYNMPILGYIYNDGEDYKFAGHEFFINEDNEIEYEESPVGVIPESASLSLKYDEEMKKTYLEGTGIIWRTYTKAAEILEREQQLSVSVELIVDELSFDSKEKQLIIDKFRFSGVTILQADRETGAEIKPGMVGSNISIADFSEKNNSVFSNKNVIELLSALNEKIDNLNINNESLKEGGINSVKKEFDENPEVAEDEVKETPSATFDGDGEPGDGEPGEDDPNYYEEGDGENGDNNDPPADDPTDPPVDPPADDDSDDDDSDDDDSDDDSGDDSGDDEPSGIPLGQRDDDDTAGSSKKKYSVEVNIDVDGEKKTFSTLIEKLDALSELVNATYGEVDNDWYAVDADEDKKIIEMHQWMGGKHFRQSYSVKKDVFSLVGDRVETYAKYLTEDEIKSLDNMKANYSSIQDELAQYKAEPEKLAVLKDECYSQIADTEDYKKLSERDTYFSMSVDEVRAELDKQLLEYAKGHKIEFSNKEDSKSSVGTKIFKVPSNKKSSGKARYGGIFNK